METKEGRHSRGRSSVTDGSQSCLPALLTGQVPLQKTSICTRWRKLTDSVCYFLAKDTKNVVSCKLNLQPSSCLDAV